MNALHVRMVARPTDEPHRSSSNLELLFDLTFVVAVASITVPFAHSLVDGHAAEGIIPFLQVFFAIWWAWMNFTWFGSAYDTDDVPYRIMTAIQMIGVLVLAAGVPAAAEHNDYRAITLGYLIMRIGLVAQWLRAAVEDPTSRGTALRYAVGISALEVAWLARQYLAQEGLLPEASLLPVFVGLVLLELAVPLWAERRQPTNWHPHHIVERYGLFAIILLGEGILAASTGVKVALELEGVNPSFVTISVAGIAILFALWWLYFLEPAGDALARNRDRFMLWGYGHYGIFAALAALGAGLKVAVEQNSQAAHQSAISPVVAAYAVAVPVVAFLVLLWAVHAPLVARAAIRPAVIHGGAVAILILPVVAAATGLAFVVASIAAVCATMIAATVALQRRTRVQTAVGSAAARSDRSAYAARSPLAPAE